MGTIWRFGALLLSLLVVTTTVSADDDEGTWNGGFYEWVWGPEASVTVGSLNATRENEAEQSTSLLQSFFSLGQAPKLQDEIVINAKPLWDKDTANFSSSGLDGVLVKSEPVHACAKVDAHPEYPTFAELDIEESDLNSTNVKTKWILIVDEGHCSIEQKMAIAEKAGYSALLMLSSDPTSDEDLTNISKRKIFAAKIAIQDGLTLIESYAYPEPVAARIEDIRDQQWSHAIYKIIGMIIAALLLLISLIAIIIKILKMRRRWKEEKEAAELRETLGRAIESMPITVWELNPMTKDEKCHICYGLFFAHDIVRTLPCFHRFHQRCIKLRFETGNTECAICHYQVLTPQQKQKASETTPLL